MSTGDIDFTVAAWVYLDSKAVRPIAEKGNNTSGYGNYEWDLRYTTNDRFRLTVQNGVNTSVDVNADNLGSPSLSTWYLVVAWHDAANNTVNIQVNNGTVNSAAYTAGSWDSAHPFTIGRGVASYFDGRIDSVGFWKRTLTSGERTALYNSGNGDEYPFTVEIPGADIIAPTVTAFTIPATASSLSVSITTFTASDAVGVTGYKLTESPTAPGAGDAGWTGSAPTSYTFSSTGTKTLYAWAKDEAGNVSTSLNASVTITLPISIKNRMVTKPTSNSVTILVKTNITSDVTVDYGLTAGYGNTATSTNATIHGVSISSLSPSTTYHYKVTVSEYGNASNTTLTSDSTFKTQLDAGSNFSFVVISDNQGHDYSESVTQIQALNPDLIISAGDNIKGTNFTPGSFANYVNAWQTEVFDYIQNLSDHVPFFYALGNHDDALNGLYSDGIAAFEQEVSNPTSVSGGEEYYSFDWGDAHFAVLNGTYNGGGSNGTIDSTQLTWLQNDLSSTSKKWKFVICHYLIYGADTDSPWRLSNWSNVATVLQNNGVVAWIDGHRHMYNRYVKNGIFYITNPNTSDVLIGNDPYANSGGDPGTIANATQYLGFTKVSVTSSRVSMIIYQKDGTVIDSFDLTPTNFELSTPSNNGYTNDSTPTFTWNASSDNASGLAKYQLYVGGSLTQDSISSGATSIDAPSTLTDGAHTWYLKAVNNAGWATQSTSTYTVNVDTAAPTVPGIPSATSPTANNKPVWSWTASTDSGSGLASIPYSVQWCGNSGFIGCGANISTSTTNSFTHSTSLADGTWYFRVLSSDILGNNSSYSSNGSVVINTTAPAGTISINSGAVYTTSSTVTLTLSATDDSDSASQLSMKISNASDFSGASYETYAISKSWTLITGDGTKTVYVKYKDSLGNESIAYSASITFDSTAPASFDLDSPGDNSYTNSERPSFKWKTTTDATSGLSKYSIEVDNGDGGDFTIDDIPTSRTTDYETNKYVAHYENFSDSDSTNNYISVYTKSTNDWGSDNNDGKLKEGKRSWKVKARDNAGNETSSSRTLFVDRTAPSVEIAQINNTKYSSNSFTTTDKTPTIFGKITDSLVGDKTDNKISAGPKNVEVKIERKNNFGLYDLQTLATVNLNETYWTSSGNKITDNSQNKSDKYSDFEFTPTTQLPLGKYRVIITGKDNADNSGGTTTFYLNIGSFEQVTTPEEKKIVEEKTKPLTPEQKEKVKEELEITNPVTPTPTPKSNIISQLRQGSLSFLAGITNFFGNVGKYFQEIAQQGQMNFAQIQKTPRKFIAKIGEWLAYSTTSFGEIVLDSKPTQISEVKVEKSTPTTVVITWKTNHLATSKVNYGLTKDYGKEVQSSTKVHDHKLEITGLTPGTKYNYEVMSQNKNYVYDANHEFTTPKE